MSIVTATSNTEYATLAGDVEKSLPIGLVLPWAGSPTKIPSHLILLTGSVATPQLVNKTQYPILFDVLGYTYGGSGDLFALPPYNGRAPVGYDASQTEFNALGKTGGAKTVALTAAQNGPHAHEVAYPDPNTSQGTDYNDTFTYAGWVNNWRFISYTSPSGEGQPHNNLQPYITQYFVIIAKTGVSTQDVYDLDEKVSDLYARDNYSTTEQIIGKWIDGKPIYRKTIDTTMPSTNNAWTNIVSLSGIDMVVKLVATLIGADGRKIQLPYYESTNYFYSFSYQPSANAIQYYGNGSSAFGGRRVIITIEYTKTTD